MATGMRTPALKLVWEAEGEETMTVLKCESGVYPTHGVFGRGNAATSVLLPGFTVSVDAVCDAE
jgi:hypothetical protein